MEKQKIYLDTNIVRRWLASDDKTIRMLDTLNINNHFIIHEFTLFELLDQIDRDEVYDKRVIEFGLRQFAKRYILSIDKITRDADRMFQSFVDYGMFGYKQIKNHLVFNFADYVSQVYGNIIAIIYAVVFNAKNKGCIKLVYDTIKWQLDDENNPNSIKNTYKEILYNGIKRAYVNNRENINAIVKNFLKDFIIKIIAIFEQEDRELDVADIGEYNKIVAELTSKYKDYHFKEILNKFVCKQHLDILQVEGTDSTEYEYYKYYITEFMTGEGRFGLNDIIDFKIFISAFKNGDRYLTNDAKSLNLYEKVFKDNLEIIEFIKKCRSIKE